MKQIDEYKVYVFDLDGTLYDQPKLRKIMAIRLAKYYLTHPLRLSEVLVLKDFRSIKDKWEELDKADYEKAGAEDASMYGLDETDIEICRYMALKSGRSISYISQIVKRWIYENPLSAVYKSRDAKLIEYIEQLRKAGKYVCVWSDYPTKDKLIAMECQVDAQYSSTDSRIKELKPSSKGLKCIIEDTKADLSDVIMIGDRYKKDGKAAIEAGVDYVILPRKVSKRNLNKMIKVED